MLFFFSNSKHVFNINWYLLRNEKKFHIKKFLSSGRKKCPAILCIEMKPLERNEEIYFPQSSFTRFSQDSNFQHWLNCIFDRNNQCKQVLYLWLLNKNVKKNRAAGTREKRKGDLFYNIYTAPKLNTQEKNENIRLMFIIEKCHV